jgi:hypothetical protein
LEKGVVFADGGRMNLGRWQREVPVTGEGLWRRQRDPPVVDGGNAEANVAAQNDEGEPYYSPKISISASLSITNSDEA